MKKHESGNKSQNVIKWVAIAIGAILVIVIFSVIFMQKMGIFGTSTASTNANYGSTAQNSILQKNCHDVQTPYQEQETYIDQEPYTDYETYSVNLKYEIGSVYQSDTLSGLNYLTTGTVQVKNIDTETGLFTATMYFTTLNDGKNAERQNQNIMPGETKTFYLTYDSDLGEDVKFSYDITPGTKSLTRPVTRYRSVTKYRMVTKYRTESVCN